VWIDYPTMTVAIERITEGFKCTKFVDGVMIKGAKKNHIGVKGIIGLSKNLTR